MLIPATSRATDITVICGPNEEDGTTLTTMERQARDESVLAYLYGMMDLQLRIGGRPVTSEERTQLTERFPITTLAQRLVGLASGQGVPPKEDINTPEYSVQGDEEQVEPAVDATIVDLGDDVDDWDEANQAFFNEGHRLED
uniref:Uncharacterized protein isoform X2 n=1 Tax=Nicotiana tabacum TaxID=4097 RepID=A0A1S4BT11_TOBAC|nr:PREDICTED: uncharacterized protein LOC107811572 isoform X2 [Nicotiana tabacum]